MCSLSRFKNGANICHPPTNWEVCTLKTGIIDSSEKSKEDRRKIFNQLVRNRIGSRSFGSFKVGDNRNNFVKGNWGKIRSGRVIKEGVENNGS